MRSSCGWETISHGQGCAGELEGGLCRRALLPGRKTVSLGGQAQVFWQIFLDVSLGFNSDDAVRPFPSSHTALPCKLRRFMVCICPSRRLAVCQLLWDDQTSRLNADNPQPERLQVLPTTSRSPRRFSPTFPQDIRGAPRFPAAQNKCSLGNRELLMKHPTEADACTWLCRVAGITVTPGLTLQQTPCRCRVPVALLSVPHTPSSWSSSLLSCKCWC